MWITVDFGKHKGKTLPQIVFFDPDWFFWAWETGVFSGSLFFEAQDIFRKATAINIPDQKVVDYYVHPSVEKFATMEIVKETQPRHVGGSQTIRKKVIDLSVPREIAQYDKLGCKTLIEQVKQHLFGSSKYRMTKERCEEFFDNGSNFALK